MSFPCSQPRVAMLALALVAFAPALHAQDRPLAITHAAVIDVGSGAVLADRTVVVEGGRIRSVSAGTEVPAGAQVIDATGKFLIPGLIDAHAHLRDPAGPTLMPLFIAHGVTGVRDMSSGCDRPGPVCLPEMREWQARIERGDLTGPRLLALSSFPLNPPWDREVSEEQARGVVRRSAEEGADWIKIYYRLSPQALAWIMDEAGRLGLAVGGHIPLRMTAAEVSRMGLRSLEHARDFLFDCFPGSEAFRATATTQNPAVDVMRAMAQEHDAAACTATFRAMIDHGTWYVPTHVTRRMDAYADDPAFRDDARRKYLPAAMWDAWQEDADRMVGLDPTPEGRAAMRAFYERGLEITGRAHAAGVRIALGTDAGDTYVFPGSGVHDELGELVKAGLTPAAALAAATLRAAEFLGVQADHGAVRPGLRADLVLLDGNPLEDIANTRTIRAVFFGGALHDRAALDAMLRGVEERVQASAPGR